MSSVEILQNLSDLLVTNNMFKDILRELGWGIILFLKKLIDIIDSVVKNTYKIINFVSSSIIENNIGVLSGIMVAILAISIAILGYKLIFKRDSKSNAFTGALLVIVVMMALPIIFNQGVKIVSSLTGSVSISTNTNEGLLSDRVIKSNLHDLMKYAKYDNFKLPSNVTTYNDIPPSILKHIDMTEILENSEIPNSKNKGIINKELDFDKNGNIVDKKFNSNMLSGRSGYYRYYVNWFSIIANFIIVGITLLFMGVKTVKIVFNLVLDRIVGTILILTDIEEGKRAKELLTHIISTFAVLMVSVFSMNLYSEFTGWIQTQQLGSGWVGVITNLVVLLGTSIALLEGPSIIQKLLGTQTESGLSRIITQINTANRMKNGISGGGKLVGKAAFGVGKYAINKGNKTGLSDDLNKGAMKYKDTYGKTTDKYGIHNIDDISKNQSDGNNINSSNGISNSENSINNNGNKQKFEGESIQDNNNKPHNKGVRVAEYSGIEQDMKESGFNKENNQENQSCEGSESADNYSNNMNSYKSNIPDELDFNEALSNHDQKTYSKRMNLNAERRQQRLDRLNTIGKHNLNSNKENDVIPRNFTKKGGER